MVKRIAGALLQAIAINRKSGRPISTQLASALRAAIIAGTLKPSERLPASRTLAKELGIARTTVVETLEQLASEGLLEARVGAGTYVSQALSVERPVPAPLLNGREPATPARLSHSMLAASSRFVH